jgi:outer membrane murein-binding lipoprotein Lpp
LGIRARETSAALLLLAGCAGGQDAARRDVDAVRAEVRALRSQNDDLARRVDALASSVDALTRRVARAPVAPAKDAPERAPVIPPDLAVVRVEPPPPPSGDEPDRGEERRAARTARPPPPIPIAVPIAAPDPGRIETLTRSGGRDIGVEADGELRRARQRPADRRAHALEEFASRYPRHPSADNALVEAAASHAEAGRADAACELARRAGDDYPAGDAMSEALERLAWCEARRGARDAERGLLERLVSDFPRSPAAGRAGARLATLSGRTGEPPEGPARSAP